MTPNRDAELRELAEEGLAYFERAGDAGDKKYVEAIRALLARTEAGADSAVAYQHREAGTEKWYDCSKEYYNTLKRHPWDRATMRRQELRALYTHPQDASGDAEVLRAALADIHAFAHRESSGPVVEDDLWTIRNMAAAAMQAKEAK